MWPRPELDAFVEHFWSVSWHLPPGATHLQETLPHPNVQMFWEIDDADPGQAAPNEVRKPRTDGEIAGVQTGRFRKTLEGSGLAVGVKFKSGAFRPFLGAPVSHLRNRTVPASEIFDDHFSKISRLVTAQHDLGEVFDQLGKILSEVAPDPDPLSSLANQLVEAGRNDINITTAEQLASCGGISIRTLQRIFYDYVGATPKWVLRRYRLHELVERANGKEPINWAEAASELGYADQAHLIRDFGCATGASPRAYRRRGDV